ncbi:MAG: hypothetical protein H0T48_14940 [Gemmatimonadaceae bacterium]|nr:hypothetical protein [Gemmatimonadaceae bacterium]
MQSSVARWASLAAVLALLSACATTGGTGTTEDPVEGPVSGPSGETVSPSGAVWPLKTRHHVDLWLHGYAMLQDDTTLVPYFRRGYKSEMNALKNRSNVSTQLDANTSRLRTRFAQNSGIVNGQFIALYFDSFDEMLEAMDLFIRAEGEPRAAGNQEAASAIALLAGYFPGPADRDWVRLFVQSLRDENSRFYRAYWDQQQRERAGVRTAVDNLWQTNRPRLQRFLDNTSQSQGEILLSLPLNGEGRTLSAGKRQNATAVTYPVRPSDAIEAIYVITHEIVGQIATTAVNDNVTPNERREGLADRYIGSAAVRAGAILLEKAAPELVDGYARYYLRSANRSVGSSPSASLATGFPLPDGIRAALVRQIEVVLGGI